MMQLLHLKGNQGFGFNEKEFDKKAQSNLKTVRSQHKTGDLAIAAITFMYKYI